MLLNRESMGGVRHGLYVVNSIIAVFLITPIIFIVLLSFGSSPWLAFPPPDWTLRWYQELFASPEWLAALLNSLRIAGTVAILALAIGVPAAFAVVRGRFPGRDALAVLFASPLIVPLVIIGIALYGLFLKLGMAGTFISFVLCHTVIALPFPIITTTNALRGFDENLEKAAIVCGASRLQALTRVTLPTIAPGIIAGGLFAFLISWDEVVLAIFMTSSELQTLPVKMWSALRLDLSPVIAAAATLMIALTLVLLAGRALLQWCFGQAPSNSRGD
jgi:putative spermidine/putrescine transport system permease protein